MADKITLDIGNGLKLNWEVFNSSDSHSLVYSPSEFREGFLYGIPLCNSVTGHSISEAVYKEKILAAQQYIENFLGIKFFKQVIFETKDFNREEFMTWGHIKTSWQINEICSLIGKYNNTTLITYPKEWLCVKRSNSNDNSKWKQLHIVPSGAATSQSVYGAVNFNQLTFYRNQNNIPNYWHISYITGFDRIPEDLMELVGIKASLEILPQIEMVVGVANSRLFGMTGSSVSIDGLSQNTSKISGGNIFQSRIALYKEKLEKELQALKGIYKGISFDVC